jgi:DNA gyrase/topoisomerase IV subunit B
MSDQNQYTEDNIRSLDWKEHIRMRPGMYIGKLGDGSSPDDGIYILLKRCSITVSMSSSWVQVKRSRFL